MYGLSDTVGKFSGAVGKGLAELSMDREYLQSRAASSDVPRNVGEGLLQTVGDVSGGLVRGVTGVLTKPIKGAQQGGVEGFFKGMAQGAVGLVVKPFVGVADGIASASEGLKNTTGVSSSHGVFAQRERWPRVLGFGGQLLPYNAEDGALAPPLFARARFPCAAGRPAP